MSVEYPGYSFYHGSVANCATIADDAECIIYFLYKTLRMKTEQITIIGRSIGTGPAIHVSSKFKFFMVVIISGFLSIKHIVKDMSMILSIFVNEYFNNVSKIGMNKSPLLLLHGKNDKIINYK